MKMQRDRYKPAVDKRVLVLLAGIMWIGVGIMLLSYAFSWLQSSQGTGAFVFSGLGVVMALVIHHFGFLRIVDTNLQRILPMVGKKCIFSFMTWKSYIIVAAMVTIGVLLRQYPVPKPYLSALYTGIGLSLILSSVRYLRVFISQLKNGTIALDRKPC